MLNENYNKINIYNETLNSKLYNFEFIILQTIIILNKLVASLF